MNINMENRAVRFLVDGADLNNGCSVVRRILWRLLTCVMLALVGVACIFAATFIIGGLALYLFSPWFGQLDVDLSMSWLGNAWWADAFRAGATIGLIFSGVIAVIACIFGMVAFIHLAKEGEIKTINKIVEPIAEGTAVVTDAVMAFGHRFCPKIEVMWPTKFTESGLAVGMNLKLDSFETIQWVITDIAFSKDKERIRVSLEDTDPERWCTYHLIYTIDGSYFDEGFEIVTEDAVDVEVSPA